jgi:hypothetical protein
MSTAACAYSVPKSLLPKLGALAGEEDVDGFWDLLDREGRRLKPDFAHAGDVLAVLLEYLEEQGLHVVAADPGPEAERILDAPVGLQACLTREEAGDILQALGNLRLSEPELGSFYEEAGGEPHPRAGRAMLEGVDFLKRSAGFITSDGDRLLLFAG